MFKTRQHYIHYCANNGVPLSDEEMVVIWATGKFEDPIVEECYKMWAADLEPLLSKPELMNQKVSDW